MSSFTKLVVAMLSAIAASLSLAACSDGEYTEDVGQTRQAIGTPTWPISGVSSTTCYHVPGSGAHKPSGGIGNADEVFALDLNCSGNSESGKAVKPIRNGTVRSFSAGSANVVSYVLIEHPESVIVDGVSYSKFYTAYLHMSGVSLSNDSSVTTATTLGYVDDYGSAGAVHLHFTAYVGEWSTSSRTNWGRLRSFNPSILGGDFASYDYGAYIYRSWVDNSASSGSYVFVANGTSSDLYTSSAYGMFGSMRYTTTKSISPTDNSFEFKWNVLTPATHQYYVWPFIPANYGTTTNATYSILSGTSTVTSSQSSVTSYVVNQYALSDDYAQKSKVTIAGSRYVTLKVGDYTGEVSKYLGADYAVIWWKADHCLGGCSYAASSEQGYCLQSDYATSGAGTSCSVSTTIPSGY